MKKFFTSKKVMIIAIIVAALTAVISITVYVVNRNSVSADNPGFEIRQVGDDYIAIPNEILDDWE